MRRRRDESPPDEACGRVTNPERFRVLHSTMLELLGRLEADFDVQREEGYGLDEELERDFVSDRSSIKLARPSVKLTPGDPEAAPLVVVFSDFPGLHLRFGLRWKELLPACGCDACGDSGEDLAQKLTRLIDNVTAGRFWERRNPLDRWAEGEGEIWGHNWSSGRGRRGTAALISFFQNKINWKPWPRRNQQVP